MHTEEEARKLWCPMAKVEFDEDDNRHIDAAGNDHLFRCCRYIASKCAMWRWDGKMGRNHGRRHENAPQGLLRFGRKA